MSDLINDGAKVPEDGVPLREVSLQCLIGAPFVIGVRLPGIEFCDWCRPCTGGVGAGTTGQGEDSNSDFGRMVAPVLAKGLLRRWPDPGVFDAILGNHETSKESSRPIAPKWGLFNPLTLRRIGTGNVVSECPDDEINKGVSR